MLRPETCWEIAGKTIEILWNIVLRIYLAHVDHIIYIYTCICMYVCMHVCMYACMHACMHACMYACMYVCMYVCVYNIYIYIYMYIYMCMYVWVCQIKPNWFSPPDAYVSIAWLVFPHLANFGLSPDSLKWIATGTQLKLQLDLFNFEKCS